MKFLNRAYNAAGPLRAMRKDQIKSYCENPSPTPEAWRQIARLTLNHAFNISTAIAAIVPGFDADNDVPDGFTVARAIKAAVQVQRRGTTKDPSPPTTP
jgi:hypothetical protein